MEYLKSLPAQKFDRPESMIERQVDVVSGYLEHDGFPARTEYFIPGTEPEGEDPVHVKLKVCKGENKLATPVHIARGDYEEKEYFKFVEQDPFEQANGSNKWQEGILNWIFENHRDDPRYNPPTEYCQIDKQIEINLISPRHQERINSNTIELKAEPGSVNEIKQVDFYIDGKLISSLSSEPYRDTVELEDGVHHLKIVVTDSEGNSDQAEVQFGVNVDWDYQPEAPTPTPTPSPAVSPTPSPSPAPSPSPTASPAPTG